MNYTVAYQDKKIEWQTRYDLMSTLEKLASSNKRTDWIRWDLKVERPTGLFKRIVALFWRVVKTSPFFRRLFFGVDYSATKRILNNLSVKVLKSDDRELIHLFKRAVNNYNQSVLSHQATPPKHHFHHYRKPDFNIDSMDLTLDVRKDRVITTQMMNVKNLRGFDFLTLNGEGQTLHAVHINGKKVSPDRIKHTDKELIIYGIPQGKSCTMTIEAEIDPFNNHSGMGLYLSGKNLTSKCESEGARKIFFTIDRPDNLCKYKTTIIADKKKYPVCLSNGNLCKRTDLGKGRVQHVYDDPMPKPSYIFATVMGDFECIKDSIYVGKGDNKKLVTLECYTERGKEKRGLWALDCLKAAMKWDEENYDRVYDLDVFRIVSVADYNSGATENKGLNVFNETSCLASLHTARDEDYYNVARVVAHEYFHNYRGNRVTIRDFSVLSAKESLTEFTTQEFLDETFDPDFNRPYQANIVRDYAFPADDGPMSHPLQVDSYLSPRSVYDNITYVKGPEVFRMLKHLMVDLSGKENIFKEALNLYFDKYDGQAVTLDELMGCVETTLDKHSVNADLDTFKRWIYQAGVPRVDLEMDYDPDTEKVTLKVMQSCLDPKTKKKQKPFYIPMNVELLGADGSKLLDKMMLHVTEEEQTFVFNGIKSKPTPLFFHGFSAPVRYNYSYEIDELFQIIALSQDPFCRSEAVDKLLAQHQKSDYIGEYITNILLSKKVNVWTKIHLLTKCQKTLNKEQLIKIEPSLLQLLEETPKPKKKNPSQDLDLTSRAVRGLREGCYRLLAVSGSVEVFDELVDLFDGGESFNDVYLAMSVLVEHQHKEAKRLLKDFHKKWKGDTFMMNHWIRLQSTSKDFSFSNLETIRKSEGFSAKNPNHLRSLYLYFLGRNNAAYNKDVANYVKMTDVIIEVNGFNTQLSATLATYAYRGYSKLPDGHRQVMKEQMEKLLEMGAMNNQVKELVRNTLNKG